MFYRILYRQYQIIAPMSPAPTALPRAQDRAQLVRDVLRALGPPLAG